MKNVVGFPDAAVIREEAAQWIARLDGEKELSPEEREALRKWIHTSPAHRQALHNAAELWGSLNILTELEPQSVEGQPNKLSSPNDNNKSHHSKWRLFASVASVVMMLFAFIVYFRSDPLLDSNGHYATVIGDQQSIELADGSVVELNTDSQIKVEFTKDIRNITLLRGEAYFVVAKIDNNPFQVNAGVGQVLAVGTAFSVYRKDDSVDVTVTEGRVSVSTVSQRTVENQSHGVKTTVMDSVTLDAGQLAIIKEPSPEQQGELGKIAELHKLSDSELSQRMLWKDGILAFSRAPLRDVVAEVSRYTTMDIQFSDQSVAETPVIARFPIGDTALMLNIFENNFGLVVTYTGPNHVLLSTKEETESE